MKQSVIHKCNTYQLLQPHSKGNNTFRRPGKDVLAKIFTSHVTSQAAGHLINPQSWQTIFLWEVFGDKCSVSAQLTFIAKWFSCIAPGAWVAVIVFFVMCVAFFGSSATYTEVPCTTSSTWPRFEPHDLQIMDSAFHVTEMLTLTTEPSGTSVCVAVITCQELVLHLSVIDHIHYYIVYWFLPLSLLS